MENKDNTYQTDNIEKGKIIKASIVKEMQSAYLDYAMSVIVARALPDIRDGLKPVQRRIVYAFSALNVTSSSRYKKSATIVGEVIGKYHPHGDTSIYDALVRMAQSFSLRYPLVDGQGNFGSIDGYTAAAMRYTECRLDKISDLLVKDIDKNTVDFADNYSGEHKEPTVLPTVIPNLLINGASGIAVGMATNIPSHNLSEVIDALIKVLEEGTVNTKQLNQSIIKIYNVLETKIDVADWEIRDDIPLENFLKVIKGPDFPTGCTVYDKSEILRYFATGKGKLIQRAKAEIVELKNGKFAIEIREVPYQVTRTMLIEKIALLHKTKRVESITEIRDESSGDDTLIVVELKKNARPQKVLNTLYKHSPLQSTFNANMVALVNNEPKLVGIKIFLDEFIKHRQAIITRRSLYKLRKIKEREHILEGLIKALDFIDEVIKIIKQSKTTDDAKTNLVKRFDLTEIQATAILEMQLKKLAALEREKIENELKEIIKVIEKLLNILKNPAVMINVMKTELLETKEKFGDKRKTRIINSTIGGFEEEDLIADEQALISVTKSGYIKRMKSDTYKTQGRGGKGVLGMKTKDNDEVTMLRLCQTHDIILFLTNKGRIYEKRIWDIPEALRQSKGTAIVNIIDMDNNERLAEILTISKDDYSNKKLFILMATRLGQIKKTAINEFLNIRKTGIIAIGLKESDKLVKASLTTGNNQIMLITENGKSIKFSEEDCRPMGRTASGVRGIKLKKDDHVITMVVVPPESTNEKLLTIMENGYGKTTKINDYTLQNRGGSGIIAAKVSPKTGKVSVARLIIEKSKKIIMTSEHGQVIKITLKGIPISTRNTQGVIMMRLSKEDKVSAVTIMGDENLEDETNNKP